MNTIRTTVIAITAILMLAATGSTARAATKEELSKRFKKRFDALQKYKDAGKVGETSTGYVEALDAKYLKDKNLKKIVEAENADRRELYELLARELSNPKTPVTAEQVGKQNAINKFKKAAGHEYFKGKDGKWRTKKEMLEAARKKAEKQGK